MIDMTTGNDLKTWRKKNRITQKQLAKKIEYSTTTISHCEYENKQLTKKMIERIEEYDKELNPNSIAKKWESIEYYKNIYRSEMSIIENAILELLTVNANTLGFLKTEAYLGYLGKSLQVLIKLKDYSFSDDDKFQTDASIILSDILKEAKLYLKK